MGLLCPIKVGDTIGSLLIESLKAHLGLIVGLQTVFGVVHFVAEDFAVGGRWQYGCEFASIFLHNIETVW
jgi:hypothetical protein